MNNQGDRPNLRFGPTLSLVVELQALGNDGRFARAVRYYSPMLKLDAEARC